jgi:hypothetical protein
MQLTVSYNIWSWQQDKAFCFHHMESYSWKGIVMLIRQVVQQPGNLLLGFAFSLEELPYLGRARNSRSYHVLQQNQNMHQWHHIPMSWFGLNSSYVICRCHTRSQPSYTVTTKLHYTSQPTLYFINAQNISRLIVILCMRKYNQDW